MMLATKYVRSQLWQSILIAASLNVTFKFVLTVIFMGASMLTLAQYYFTGASLNVAHYTN